MKKRLRVLMVAAENDALAGGKVGGIGDVVRDVPPALAEQGSEVAVITPSYGFLHKVNGAKREGLVSFRFAGEEARAEIFEVPGKRHHDKVRHFVVDHPRFLSLDRGRHQIYVNDPSDEPFATDATKFALFSTAVAEAVRRQLFGRLDVVHLHDWHAAFYSILRQFDKAYQALQGPRTVYTIHNLALQGIRPFADSDSALTTWFPELTYDRAVLADPRWPDAVNPMAVGIRLSDAVHTVSPSYAEEILLSSDRPGYYGGEGLEADLRQAKAEGRLFGILNGCEYPENRAVRKLSSSDLLTFLRTEVFKWIARQPEVPSAHFLANVCLSEAVASGTRSNLIVTSVGRVVDQKAFLMREPGSQYASGLSGILEELGDRGIFILLGSGDPQYERFLLDMTARFSNFVFLNGYSDACATALYASGDLFLMPSSFEPCGISQMLAMRDGQPCLAHSVGGLKDTVHHQVDGFTFDGTAVQEQVDGFVRTFSEAIRLKQSDPAKWEDICRKAAEARFDWSETVKQYLKKLYRQPSVSRTKEAA